MTCTCEAARLLAAEQAEDEGLWFVAMTAPEAYLQEALRKLHAAVEGVSPEAIGLEKLRELLDIETHEGTR